MKAHGERPGQRGQGIEQPNETRREQSRGEDEDQERRPEFIEGRLFEIEGLIAGEVMPLYEEGMEELVDASQGADPATEEPAQDDRGGQKQKCGKSLDHQSSRGDRADQTQQWIYSQE